MNRPVAWVADVGATWVRCALVGANKRLHCLGRWRLDQFVSPKDAIGAMAHHWRLAGESSPTGVGVCFPASISHTGQIVYAPTIPAWQGLDIRRVLTEETQVSTVELLFDPHAALLGEAWAAGPLSQNTLFLAVGSGISAGLALDGHHARGAHGLAGMMAAPVSGLDKPVEAFASGKAVARMLKVSTGEQAIELARQGHPDALAVFRTASMAVMRALAAATSLTDSDTVVVGGGFGLAAFDLLFGSGVLPQETRFYPPIHDAVRIIAARSGADAQLLGAAAACFGVTNLKSERKQHD